MASYSKSGVAGRVIVLVVLNIALVLGGLLWFDYLGVVNAKALFGPLFGWLGLVPQTKPGLAGDDPSLLDSARAAALGEGVALRSEELDKRTEALDKKDMDITQKAQNLDEREKALAEKEKSFIAAGAAADDRDANIAQNAGYLTGMRPENAVKILEKMDDQDIIDIFRKVDANAAAAGEASIVSYWLSLMDPTKAAVVQRKMASKPKALE